jgi:hypothetical protein
MVAAPGCRRDGTRSTLARPTCMMRRSVGRLYPGRKLVEIPRGAATGGGSRCAAECDQSARFVGVLKIVGPHDPGVGRA